MTAPTLPICERLREPHWMPDADYMRSPESISGTVKLMREERTEAADLIQQQQATIERLNAALERAIEAIQTERDCLVECATTPPEHDLSTLDPDTKPHVEEYDAMLAYLRAALGKDASDE